jgi:hypothetical protein
MTLIFRRVSSLRVLAVWLVTFLAFPILHQIVSTPISNFWSGLSRRNRRWFFARIQIQLLLAGPDNRRECLMNLDKKWPSALVKILAGFGLGA